MFLLTIIQVVSWLGTKKIYKLLYKKLIVEHINGFFFFLVQFYISCL